MKKIWSNIKFFIFNAPAHIGTNAKPCDYCGGKEARTEMGGWCICTKCQQKAFDKILKPNQVGKPIKG